MKTTLAQKIRGSRKTLLVLLALGGTLGAVPAASLQDAGQPKVAVVTATQPSMASFIGVGGLSLIGLLALRRRVRGFQG